MNRVFTIARGSGTVEAGIRLRPEEDVEDGDLDLAPDGRLIVAADGSILTAAPGVAQSRIPGDGFTQPRFSGRRHRRVAGGSLRRPPAGGAGPGRGAARRSAARPPTWSCSRPTTVARRGSPTAACCTPRATASRQPSRRPGHARARRCSSRRETRSCAGAGSTSWSPASPRPRRDAGGPSCWARGAAGRAAFQLAPGTRRTVRIRLTDRGARHVRRQRRREGIAVLGLSARVRDGRVHGTGAVVVARVR